MDKKELRDLFQNKYDSKKWKDFLKEIFRDLPSDYFQNSQNLKDESLNKHQNIDRISKFGDITLKDDTINFYEVELKNDHHVTRNRVGLRNILAGEVDGAEVSGVIAVYYNKKDNDWRFSFISKKYSWNEKNQEIKEETTPKRYTYLFGKDEKVKTALEQFYKLYETLNKNNTLDIGDLLKAFSVEKISKEFFSGYKQHHENFVYDLVNSNFKNSAFKGNGKAISNFVKKLLGRIVFLYFVQKKGWLGATDQRYKDGDKDFVRNYFEKSEKEKFYSCYLQKLFFEALNQERKDDDFKMPDGSKVKIPFLNGGLFDKESDKYDKINFSPSLFGGFFDFLAKYNFTIDESSPDDVEIGVDPEMLGHIFENLLEDNKEKGAFYTPKEIVQYMTQESLIEYLHTNLPEIEKKHITDFVKDKKLKKVKNSLNEIDDLLDEVKICDPAIGSGAFPMGLLQEIFTLRSLIKYEQGYDVREPAKIKKAIIQNSIYGVDIEKGAVDIARLRFWLSLVVDEEEPKPLPNLDYKIVCGNSLVDKFEDEIIKIDWEPKPYEEINLFNDELVKEKMKLLQKISKKQKDFFTTNDANQKATLKKEIRNLKLDILSKQLTLMIGDYQEPKGKRLTKKDTERLSEVAGWKRALKEINILKNNEEPFNHFDWELDFPEILNPFINTDKSKKGFNIVIGNPPYVQLQKMGEESKKLKQQNYQTYEAKADLYCLFYEQGYKLLKNGGHLCFITSNKWMRAGYGKSLRQFFIDKTTPKTLIDLGPKVFKATVDTNILLTQKCTDKPKNDECKAATLSDTNKLPKPNLNEISLPKGEASWIILSDIEQQIKAKIEAIGTPLKDWNTAINYGIKTGYNDAFIIDKDNKERLVAEDPKSAEIIRPILRGEDIKRYEAKWADLYLIGTFPALKIDIDDYPTIKQYLEKFLPKLHQTGETYINEKGETEKTRKKNTNKWYETQDSIGYWRDFYKQKIVWQRITQEPTFCLSEEGQLILDSMAFLVSSDKSLDKYLLSILNSKLIAYWVDKNVHQYGNTGYRLSNQYVEQIPIPKISKDEQQPFINLVDKILSKKSRNEDTTKEEQEIDKMVYKLYHLNEEEIHFITAND